MAASLWILLDDIATVLDDVAVLTKVAARKTAGVLGDDLALNAEQVAGVRADRELPVVWAVAKGSLRNKVVLVPLAMALSVLLPFAITPLLVLGGLFLCFEGAEKLLHRWIDHGAAAHAAALRDAVRRPEVSLVEVEADKIRGAIRTDFILSAEIVVIALGSVQGQPWPTQALVLSGLSLWMTVGVYGLVATIVKLDDVGEALQHTPTTATSAGLRQSIGAALLWIMPRLMKGLALAGTTAMFLVGGGILVHALPAIHHATEQWPALGTTMLSGALGLIAGTLLVGVTVLGRRLRRLAVFCLPILAFIVGIGGANGFGGFSPVAGAAVGRPDADEQHG